MAVSGSEVKYDTMPYTGDSSDLSSSSSVAEARQDPRRRRK